MFQTFTAAAILAKVTDADRNHARPRRDSLLARELDMQLAKAPIKLPEFDIAQYWHERFDRDPRQSVATVDRSTPSSAAVARPPAQQK